MFNVTLEMMRRVQLYNGRLLYSTMTITVRANNDAQAIKKAEKELPNWWYTKIIETPKRRKPLK